MTEPDRPRPPRNADEKRTLESYLDWYREAIIDKVKELTDEDAKKHHVSSQTTLFGIVHHLACVERWWFQDVFADRRVTYPWTDEDPDAEWRTDYPLLLEEAVALYEKECAENRKITGAASPDDLARHEKYRDMSLRRIMVHMIEETARHAGHADILRELTDGVTGE